MTANVVRPLVLAISCLILGFVGGWTLATLGGDEVSLPDANVDVTVQTPAPQTTSVPEAQDPVPERAEVTVSVLNGTDRAGFAATTATTLKDLGYANVTPGDAPTGGGPSIVYFRDGSRPAADRLADDLGVSEVAALEGSPIETGTTTETDLVVVLGA